MRGDVKQRCSACALVTVLHAVATICNVLPRDSSLQQLTQNTSFPGVKVQAHAFYSVALRAVGCGVLLCFRRSGVHWVRGAVAGCLLGALFVCFRSVLLVRARGPAVRLGVGLLGFPLLLAMLHLFPLVRLLVTLTQRLFAATYFTTSPIGGVGLSRYHTLNYHEVSPRPSRLCAKHARLSEQSTRSGTASAQPIKRVN